MSETVLDGASDPQEFTEIKRHYRMAVFGIKILSLITNSDGKPLGSLQPVLFLSVHLFQVIA